MRRSRELQTARSPAADHPGLHLLSLLGSGGFSDVYLYEQDRPRRKVAVKVLLSDLKTEGARRRFESEANLMAQLSSHPYIVTIFEAEITDDGHSYLAMEYCSRPSLDVRYRRQRFSVDEVLAVGIQVASAVETAHRAGIAHRDIKPANILVTDYNRPALTDFGIAGTLAGDADEDAGMSIPWSPPEQFTGHQVDGVLVDVWALGATLYTLLAGRSPFVLPGADNSQRELISRITNLPLPKLGRADVPESLELALSTAMAKSAVVPLLLRARLCPGPATDPGRTEPFRDPLRGPRGARAPRKTTRRRLRGNPRPQRRLDRPGRHRQRPDLPGRFPRRGSPAPRPTTPRRTTVNGGASTTQGFNNTAFTNETVQRPPGWPASTGPPPGTQPGTMTTSPPRSTAPAPLPLPRTERTAARTTAPGEHPAGHGRRNLLLSIVGGTVLVAAVVLGIVAGTTGPEPAPKATDQSASRPPMPWTTVPSRTSAGWPVCRGRPGRSVSPGPTRSRNRGTATSGGSTRSRPTAPSRPPPRHGPK